VKSYLKIEKKIDDYYDEAKIDPCGLLSASTVILLSSPSVKREVTTNAVNALYDWMCEGPGLLILL